MRELIVELKNEQGLHARPSAEIVKIVRKYNSELRIIKDDIEVDGSSIMELMTLAAEKGQKLILKADGEDEKELLDILQKFIEVNKFFEE